MDVYTIQMSNHRIAAAKNIPILDITVKSGIPAFAPTWDMVLGYKSGTLTESEYTLQYYIQMRHSYMSSDTRYRHAWDRMLELPLFAVACFCPVGAFCHRHLFVDMIDKVCRQKHIPYQYLGELVS